MNKKITLAPLGLVITAIAVIAIAGCAFLWIKNLKLERKNADLESAQKLTAEQVKIINFGGQFVDDVLNANTAVSFETRLKLENDVREIGDQEILNQWQKFTASKTDADAQAEVKRLLKIFFTKLGR